MYVGLRRGVGRVLRCVDAFVDLVAEVVVDREVHIRALDVLYVCMYVCIYVHMYVCDDGQGRTHISDLSS
jgi:hypothetical protein